LGARVWVWNAFASAVLVVPEHLGIADTKAIFEAKTLAFTGVEVPNVVGWASLRQADAFSVDSVEDVSTTALLLFVAAAAIVGVLSTNFVLISSTHWQGWAVTQTTSQTRISDSVLGLDLGKVVNVSVGHRCV